MKKYRKVIAILILVCMTGCNDSEAERKSKNESSDLFEVVENSTSNIIENGESQGKQMTLEKTDAKELEKYNASNRMLSDIMEDNQNSLFCMDSNTGAVYFVNQGKDWYIYCLQNGKAELAVELPARELYMWNETLYFMVEDYDKYELAGVNENDIYAYTPADGSVKLIYSATEFENAMESHLGVNEEGIYMCFKKRGEEINIDGRTGYQTDSFYYRLPFGGSEPVEDSYLKALAGWGEYYYLGNSMFFHRESGAERRLELAVPSDQCCIIDDKFYSIDTNAVMLYITDMISGETTSFDCKFLLENVVLGGLEKKISEGGFDLVQSFSVTKEYIWLVVQGAYLVRINPENGEMKCYDAVLFHEMELVDSYIETLYTDGVNLYALYRPGSFDAPAIVVRVNTEKTDEVLPLHKVPSLTVEALTE